MRRSRKGTRLNEAQYFDYSLRPLTKKIKKLRLFPQSSEENLSQCDDFENATKIRHNPQALARDQPSTEITRINYVDSTKIPALGGHDKDHRDISIQISSKQLLEEFPPSLEKNEENDEPLMISEEISVIESFRSEEIDGVCDNYESIISKNREEDEVLEDEILQGQENRDDDEENVTQSVENNHLKNSEEECKREEKTWWRMIIDFFGIFWWRRDDKRNNRNRTKKSEGRTLLTGDKENSRIRQIYISSLGRDVAKEKKKPRSPKSLEKHGDECEDSEKLRMRQMSSPLY